MSSPIEQVLRTVNEELASFNADVRVEYDIRFREYTLTYRTNHRTFTARMLRSMSGGELTHALITAARQLVYRRPRFLRYPKRIAELKREA